MPVLLGTGRGPKARQAGSRAYATLDPMRWASSSTLAHLIHNVKQSALVPGICVPVPLGNRLNEIRYTFFVTHVYQATGADCLERENGIVGVEHDHVKGMPVQAAHGCNHAGLKPLPPQWIAPGGGAGMRYQSEVDVAVGPTRAERGAEKVGSRNLREIRQNAPDPFLDQLQINGNELSDTHLPLSCGVHLPRRQPLI